MVGRLATCHPTGKDDGLGFRVFLFNAPTCISGRVSQFECPILCVGIGGRTACDTTIQQS